MSEPRVLVIGDVMTDVIVVPEGPLVRGSDRRASIRSRPGGSGANQAVWLAAAGARTSFVGRVGAVFRVALQAAFVGIARRRLAQIARVVPVARLAFGVAGLVVVTAGRGGFPVVVRHGVGPSAAKFEDHVQIDGQGAFAG